MPDASQLNLLPKPASVTVGDGVLTLPSTAGIDGPPEWAAIVRRLIGPGTGLDLLPADDGVVQLVRDDSLPAEAYRLSVTAERITITAADDRGVNWAAQTLRQLLPPTAFGPAPLRQAQGSSQQQAQGSSQQQAQGSSQQQAQGSSQQQAVVSVPLVEISDQPRFAWRGVMLDTGRHFTTFGDLIGFVDLLAMHKYNTFHLHLTEDQGWRFESKKYPKLTEISSWRTETKNPAWESADGTPHGGFYSQDQLRTLVSYAADRGITVVPEIEFPGHVLAVLKAMPELGNDPDKDYQAATTWGVFPEVLNMSDRALQFAFDIWAEVLDIFPSKYIHVGGDECPRVEWEQSEKAKELAAERGLPGPDHLQRWFTEQLRDWLAERGRQLVGWDEINDEGILTGAVTMAWRDEKYGVAAAKGGLPVVMSPVSKTYFDYYPSDLAEEYYSIGGLITTERAYSLEPTEGIPAELQDHILGTQCQVWTEYMPDMRRIQYMLFPRACAHSEVAWSDPTGRDFSEFSTRLAGHLSRLDALGINYRPEAGPLPWQQGGTGLRRRPDAHQRS